MRKFLQKILIFIFPQLHILKSREYDFTKLRSWKHNAVLGKKVVVEPIVHLCDVEVGDYSYISYDCKISGTTIGKFCSLGPNLFCGWGIHPTNGISTSPIFFSSKKQYGYTFSDEDKVIERKHIKIGNDVWTGANVVILDGVTIGDGAIIGAGAVVSKDIPPYAIAVGCPIQIKRYRFPQNQIDALLRIKWWDFDENKLCDIERMFFDIDGFIRKYDKTDKSE